MGGLSRLTASVHGGGNMTLREYILFWQETYDRHQSRPTTYAAHNYVFKNHILPGLGDVLLSELTSERVGEFLEERKHFGNNRPGSSGLGEETMRHIHRLLQQCLDQAIRDGLLTENPAKAFHYRKYMTVKANIMTSLEMEDYLDAAERLGYLSMFMLALTAGLGNSMKKLKLPKTIAKDFFTELASADRCVCDRCIGERERTAILKRADQYLGSDQQSVLNTVKSSLMDSVYDERLKKAFEELKELRAQANRLDTRFKTNEEKLIKAGGEKARELQERIEELIRLISIARDELERIESKDENDASLTEENNLHKADQKFKYYEQEIAKATRTNTALRKKELVDSLVNEIKLQATTALKQEIVRKTNEKLRRVIVDDYVEIESIDRYIKLKGRDGASEGQTLSIAYCFLGTLFEDSELEFPFIIDSPTGKMDFEKRQAVADIIPLVFNQMIAFVQSAEVERFADRFYANPDSQYLTVVASPQDQAVVVYEGIDFFDSYQREHKGDEK